MNITVGTVTRTLCLLVALVNQILVVFNKSPLPIEDENLANLISTVTTIVTAVIAWWKNNSFTKEAIEADATLSELKAEKRSHKKDEEEELDEEGALNE